MADDDQLRIDKWLWAVRLFKTRSLAIQACKGGRVKVNGQNAKPARTISVGEIVTVKSGPITRTLKVIGLLDRRAGAKFVPDYVEDLTPEEQYKKPRETAPSIGSRYANRKGRPTKKDRRMLDQLGF